MDDRQKLVEGLCRKSFAIFSKHKRKKLVEDLHEMGSAILIVSLYLRMIENCINYIKH